jgi:hypothetical protein
MIGGPLLLNLSFTYGGGAWVRVFGWVFMASFLACVSYLSRSFGLNYEGVSVVKGSLFFSVVYARGRHKEPRWTSCRGGWVLFWAATQNLATKFGLIFFLCVEF